MTQPSRSERSTAPPLPQLLCFPSTDIGFATVVARALDASADRSIRGLEERLRARYPGVRIRRRDLSGEATETWYVYRDGHV
jgi:hypothetical protein